MKLQWKWYVEKIENKINDYDNPYNISNHTGFSSPWPIWFVMPFETC